MVMIPGLRTPPNPALPQRPRPTVQGNANPAAFNLAQQFMGQPNMPARKKPALNAPYRPYSGGMGYGQVRPWEGKLSQFMGKYRI